MKRNILYNIVLALFVVMFSASMRGQSLSSGYFLDGFYSQHEMNPALVPESSYFSLPVIGGIGLNANSNAGISDFIYNSTSYPGKLTTFMSSDVDRVQFLSNLKNVTELQAGLSMNIFSVGFKSFGGYNFIGLNLKNSENVRLPKELFEFMKSGLTQGIYGIDNTRIISNSYADLEFGHSRSIDERLKIGVKLHLLAGMAYADLNAKHIEAVTMADKWQVRMAAEVLAGGDISYSQKEDGAVDLNSVKYKFSGISGFGLAADIGVAYDISDIVSGLSFSASVTDLGFISWNKGKSLSTDPTKYVVFDGFHNVTTNQDIDDQIEKIGDDFKAMTNLYENAPGAFPGNPVATARFGIQYKFPFADWIGAGELLTYRIGWKTFESRTSVNIAPAKWFDASVNVAFSTFGTNLGWVVNFHPKGFNFFIGSDGIRATLNNSIPVSETSANIVLGMKFPVHQD